MSRSAPIGERLNASRIDDLASTHIRAFPKPRHFGGHHTPSRRRPGPASPTRISALLRTAAPMR
jgi:hypothetical protein